MIRPFFPRVAVRGWTSGESHAEYEGHEVSLYWLGFTVQIAIGRCTWWDHA